VPGKEGPEETRPAVKASAKSARTAIPVRARRTRFCQPDRERVMNVLGSGICHQPTYGIALGVPSTGGSPRRE
jgi:hypothetical protein